MRVGEKGEEKKRGKEERKCGLLSIRRKGCGREGEEKHKKERRVPGSNRDQEGVKEGKTCVEFPFHRNAGLGGGERGKKLNPFCRPMAVG